MYYTKKFTSKIIDSGKGMLMGLLILQLALFSCSKTPTSFPEEELPTAGWVIGDYHEHSHFTDGGYQLDSVFSMGANKYGVHFMVNTDHGGAYPRNYDGRNWSAFPDVVFLGDSAGTTEEGERKMWRWQILRDYSYPRVAAYRKNNPGRHYIQGLEWNSPATSHTSTGIIADSGLPIAMFEYQFDHGDRDTSGGPGEGLVKNNGRENGNGEMMSKEERTKATTAALQWLMKHHRYSSWTIIAHPERGGNVEPADLRNINNAGPDVAFGFEGIPGHQKNTLRAIFYPEHALGEGTYGGVGYMAAKVGGVWDALLGEGRHFWLFTSSDFHGMQSDFWPGEYHKTWIYSKDTTNAHEILSGMRSGNVFVVNGDLINDLYFSAESSGERSTMGESLPVSQGKPVAISIRFRSPEKNHNVDRPKVQTVQLIMGEVTGKIDPSSPDYNKGTNESTRVVKQFTSEGFKTKDGWTEISFQIPKLDKNSYLRIRGTNHLPGTEFETDPQGHPLPDSLATNLNLDGPAEAWADLWFYSNPIFLEVK